jgi:hypothetical protein
MLIITLLFEKVLNQTKILFTTVSVELTRVEVEKSILGLPNKMLWRIIDLYLVESSSMHGGESSNYDGILQSWVFWWLLAIQINGTYYLTCIYNIPTV